MQNYRYCSAKYLYTLLVLSVFKKNILGIEKKIVFRFYQNQLPIIGPNEGTTFFKRD